MTFLGITKVTILLTLTCDTITFPSRFAGTVERARGVCARCVDIAIVCVVAALVYVYGKTNLQDCSALSGCRKTPTKLPFGRHEIDFGRYKFGM